MTLFIPDPREIRAARLELRLSQQEASEIAGVSESTWLNWETDPMFSSYEIPRKAAWELFLSKTSDLRHADSRWKLHAPGTPRRVPTQFQ